MATNGFIGNRDLYVPNINDIGITPQLNQMLRSFANFNITKLSYMPFVPHGIYLGGYEGTGGTADSETAENIDITDTKTNRIDTGYRRLPIMGGVVNGTQPSAFKPTFKNKIDSTLGLTMFGTQYKYHDFWTKATVVTDSTKDRLSKEYAMFDPNVFRSTSKSSLTKDIDYVVFDMSKTMMIPFSPQYKFLNFNGGYLPFYEVCEIINDTTISSGNVSSRNTTRAYPTGLTSSDAVLRNNIQTADLTILSHGDLFCVQYVWNMGRSGGDNISSNNILPKVIQPGAICNPGTAHVLFIELGDCNQERFTDSDNDTV